MKLNMYICGLVLLALAGCESKVTEMVTYKIQEPVFMPVQQFRNSVKVSDVPQQITAIGKMCFFEGFLYISEPEKGIHIIDNHNPAEPKITGFIELLGNADLSIRNGMLYADSFIDLVWFDITNPASPVLKGRLENVFSNALPMMDSRYGYDYQMTYEGASKGIVVGWEVKERTEEFTHYTGGSWWGRPDLMMEGAVAYSSSGGSKTGATGSMSRFAIYSDNLYTVINNKMTIFDLKPASPVKVSENIYIGGNVETIFSYEDNMFMGTPTGLLIYSVKDPLRPEFQSSISHVFGCDPVVVENDIAYVTIHSGNFCGQNANDLIIIDVSDVKKPQQIVTYAMKNPKGLGIDNNKLFLCDDGLKIYQVGNPQLLMSNNVAHFKDMDGYDVIAYNNLLMMIATDGIYQYDYSNISDIRLLSKLSIGK